jgi:hypothetical protein
VYHGGKATRKAVWGKLFRNGAEITVWWHAPRTALLDTGQVTRLDATFPSMSRLRPAEQQRLLAELGRIAEDQFGGRVERHMVTPMYPARRGYSEPVRHSRVGLAKCV